MRLRVGAGAKVGAGLVSDEVGGSVRHTGTAGPIRSAGGRDPWSKLCCDPGRCSAKERASAMGSDSSGAVPAEETRTSTAGSFASGTDDVGAGLRPGVLAGGALLGGGSTSGLWSRASGMFGVACAAGDCSAGCAGRRRTTRGCCAAAVAARVDDTALVGAAAVVGAAWVPSKGPVVGGAGRTGSAVLGGSAGSGVRAVGLGEGVRCTVATGGCGAAG